MHISGKITLQLLVCAGSVKVVCRNAKIHAQFRENYMKF